VRVSDLRQARYFGLPKTHLQQVITATAINVRRIVSWLIEPELAPTQVSRAGCARFTTQQASGVTGFGEFANAVNSDIKTLECPPKIHTIHILTLEYFCFNLIGCT
jgi:hypothetical protein